MTGAKRMLVAAILLGGHVTQGAAAAETACVPSAGPAPLRRLTREQYTNTVADLLASDRAPGERRGGGGLPADETVGAFRSNLVAAPTELDVQQLMEAAERAARSATDRHGELYTCDAGEDHCVARFVERFGRRAWRRPLRSDERARYVRMFQDGEREGGAREGVRAVVEALLQSPYFVHHTQDDVYPVGGAIAPLGPFALASRLSYALWVSAPDDLLLDAAATGALATPEGLRAQATRMLGVKKQATAEDRHKLESHLESVRRIETRLEQKPVACSRVVRQPQALDPNAADNVPAILDLQQDLLVASLACDITRVASLQYRVGENDSQRYPWLGIDQEDHHLLSHAGDSAADQRGKLIKIYTWYADRFARLLDGLAAVREGDETLLDNTLVVWGSEIAKGNTHGFIGMPFVTAGSCGGRVRTGRFLEYAPSTPHNRLLVSICHAMGLPDIERFGSTDDGRGPLQRLAV